jgi:hypothetical protein
LKKINQKSDKQVVLEIIGPDVFNRWEFFSATNHEKSPSERNTHQSGSLPFSSI